ncbi:ATP-binding protein [Arenimonas fontis]|uniref:Sensory/regulatory protein RpfC n=1 Tax=Arenimonas fontis TaxID=2608255 RepID=A0A5B2ZBJ0_9GAMM|nr:ATP-binding protein [Arenimonas fontis]KAA2286038.1 response regulator [Arenimonas fontis]
MIRAFANRPDSEHGQALTRFAVTMVILVYLLGVTYGSEVDNEPLRLVFLFFAIEGVVGLGILIAIVLNPGVSHVRRVIGMLSDYAMMGAAMHVLGESLAPVYVVLMWVTIGNGLRFGERYLIAAILMASASFLAVILTTPYWQQNQMLAWGLLLGLSAIPAYLTSLLRALTRATAEAKRASEAKTRFLANMSHEFRTPLNGIVGMSQLLSTTHLSQEQRECTEVIQTSARALLALVEDVLDISAIEAGKLKLMVEDFRLRELIRGVQVMLQPSAAEKGLAFVVTVSDRVPDALHGDAGHLRQILVNLLNNAIKFTDVGKVALEVAIAPPRKREVSERAAESAPEIMLRFSVRDTGIGIPQEAQKRLFEAFEQVDSGRTRRYGGTGLGTTIAKGLAETMGGRLGFESEEGAGSHFWVELPYRLAEGSTLPAEAEGANVIAFDDPFVRHRARVKPLRLLIADDHQANRMVLRRLLEKAGHAVEEVDTGDAVLNLMAERDFDAVIIDLHMPGISGLDILREVRVMEAGSGHRTPFMVLTADVTPEAIQACEQAGARAFLPKPVVAARLLESLAEMALGSSDDASSAGASQVGGATAVVLDDSVLGELAELNLGKDFVRNFVQQCLRDGLRCLNSLEQCAAMSDWDGFRDQCHALKGVAGNLGMSRVAAMGGEVMRLPNWQLAKEWRARERALREQFELAREALARLPSRSGGQCSDDASG